MLWTVPFDALSLPISLPLDSKLDRPVLVAMAAIWLGGIAFGRAGTRPRLRFTAVHVAMLAFFALCLIGAALNEHALDQQAEVTLVVKKLAILVTYLMLFRSSPLGCAPARCRASPCCCSSSGRSPAWAR